MKVLYIGNYRDGTGWANAAQGYIMALNSVGIDVVPRAIKLNPNEGQVLPDILELEKKDAHGCDIVIQHVLPHLLDYRGEFDKNISLFVTETDNFRRIGWQNHINLMDEAWVACQQSKFACQQSEISIPISVVPHACDPSKYSRRWEKLEFKELEGKFVFYFIGEVTRRKNLVALLKAFHLEFEPDEQVGLLIKANYPGLSPADCSQKIVEMSRDVKTQLKKFKNISTYKGEVVVAQTLTDDQIMQLHAGGDCFVMPSFGEGWNIPAFDAMAMGKTPICTYTGGMADFLNVLVTMVDGTGIPRTHYEEAGWLIDGYIEPCFGMHGCAVPELYTGMENWVNIDVNALRYAMREAFEDTEQRKKKAALGIDRAYDFSYEEVGQKMKELLNGKAVLSNWARSFRKKHDCRFMVEKQVVDLPAQTTES